MACKKKSKKEGIVPPLVPVKPDKKKCKPEEPMEKKKCKKNEVAPKPSKEDMKKKMENLRKLRKK